MKPAMEVSRGLHCKLRMMGVPIEGPTHKYGDNMSTMYNTQHQSLSSRRNPSAYATMLFQRQSQWKSLTGHAKTDNNSADLFDKVVSGV